MLNEDREHILNVYRRLPLEIIDAEGAYLIGKSGVRYLDMFSGLGVNTLGHKHPAILRALDDQSKRFLHLSNFFANEPAIALARTLTKHTGFTKAFFANSGSEANEAALKLARKYGRRLHPDKTTVIALEKGFHGRTSGSLAMTGNDAYKRQFAPLLPGIIHVGSEDTATLENAVDDNTCAIIFEPIQGEGGVRPLSEAFINTMTGLREKHGLLLIADEVQTGLMRTGTLFAYQQMGFTPDLITSAKALGGGLPLGALLVPEHLEDVLVAGDHGTTFGGNPLATALGNAVLDVITEEGFTRKLAETIDYLEKGLRRLQSAHPAIILDVRGTGLMRGLEVGGHAAAIKDAALERNLLLNVTAGSVIRLLPPLTISKEALDYFFITLDSILEERS